MLPRVQPRRWIVHLALAFGVGVLLGWALPLHAAMFVGLGVSIALTIVLHACKRSLYFGLMAVAVFLGMLRSAVAANPALPPEGKYLVEASVAGEAVLREEDGRVAVYLRKVCLSNDAGSYQVSGAYWTYWPEEIVLPTDGERIAFSAQLYHPSAQRNPYGFDFRLYLLQKGVSIGLNGGEDVRVVDAGRESPFLRMRQWIRARLSLLLGADAGLATTLIISDKRDLPEELLEDFRQAGVAHVLAVSGLHVAILYSLVERLLRHFSPAQGQVLLITAVFLTFYCLIAGAQAALLRASLWLLYRLLSRVCRRQSDPLTGIALAFLIILIFRPLELLSAGFQMSFAAVLGLIMLGDRAQQLLERVRNRRLKTVLSAYAMTLCANVAVALPVSWHYHRLSLVGLLINPALCAAISVLLPLYLLLLLFSCITLPGAMLLAKGVALLSRLTTLMVQWAANAPLASILVPRLPWYMMVVIVFGLVLCTRYVLLSGKTRLLLGIGALALASCIAWGTYSRDVRYIQLSMGNEDAALILDGGQTVVIDVGSNGSDVASYLLSTGRRADVVILTHLHVDHALGLRQLLDAGVEIGTIYLSTEATRLRVAEQCMDILNEAQARGMTVKTLCEGDTLTLPRVTMRVLWPERDGSKPHSDGNDFALAMRLDLDGVILLHMSDVSGAYEGYSAVPCDVLKAAHHGSLSSTSERFLAQVQPQVVLLSANNVHQKLLERLAQAGCAWYDTSERGAVTLTVRDGKLAISTFR